MPESHSALCNGLALNKQSPRSALPQTEASFTQPCLKNWLKTALLRSDTESSSPNRLNSVCSHLLHRNSAEYGDLHFDLNSSPSAGYRARSSFDRFSKTPVPINFCQSNQPCCPRVNHNKSRNGNLSALAWEGRTHAPILPIRHHRRANCFFALDPLLLFSANVDALFPDTGKQGDYTRAKYQCLSGTCANCDNISGFGAVSLRFPKTFECRRFVSPASGT